MKILAFELSANVRSVAAWDSADASPPVVIFEDHTQHTRLFAMIQSALKSAGWPREQVQGLAVGLGPGSYTGIRMAIAAALGWRAARTVHLWGVSSFDAMAEGLWRSGRRGKVYLAVDAQRQEACWAGYQLAENGWQQCDPLQLLPQAEVCRRATAGAPPLGPDIKKWCAHAQDWQPTAGELARLAALMPPLSQEDSLTPIYLREARFAKAPPPRELRNL